MSMLLGLRRLTLAQRRRLKARPVADYGPDADSGLTATGGIPISWSQLHRYKLQKMRMYDYTCPTAERRLADEVARDPHYTKLKR